MLMKKDEPLGVDVLSTSRALVDFTLRKDAEDEEAEEDGMKKMEKQAP